MTIEIIQQDFFERCDDGLPKYRRLAETMAHLIESGLLTAGSKLPTHRAMADKLQVTVGTITRAYAEAERRGLVEARVGAGTYVCQSNRPGWVFSYPSQAPDECNFGYNIPPYLDRSAPLAQAMQTLAQQADQLNHLMLYQDPQGLSEHRDVICHWLNRHGILLDPARMHFTSGAQHAIQLVLSVFCRSGDTLLTEQVVYPGFLGLARQMQLNVKAVEMDQQGLIPESLDTACRLYQPRMLYCTPTLQNPTTAVMSRERREAILAVCRRHQVLVIEDDVNGLLPVDAPPPMVNLDSEQVIHFGSLSKCLAPGLRLGYIQVPGKHQDRLNTALHHHCLMISPLLSALACELIHRGDADRLLTAIREDIAQRKLLLDRYLHSYHIQHHAQSFHAWLTLPDNWRLSDFVAAAQAREVIVKSAELFTPPGSTIPQAVRLAISAPHNHDKLEQGLAILAELLAQEPYPDFPL
ncbi:PLP-dependent aminotransferase family protein [Photobacterium sp. WH77]|uniref:aminotransferase-like domain-containing protein n=1 Tax=unclassified Photobacterium TaxID=2628852 RepID=UPI001EDA194D|nr:MULTISPECIES: PLP-dependent aminotransferase family protein [unclassified Photobacterium]MCG2837037.1 PLP-dependent aminotransferase family protein [Photobacterium sp. WH77]MCG2844813.1 PLP-dependent aminotransferase family protein [Photobacterium sp. WH80]